MKLRDGEDSLDGRAPSNESQAPPALLVALASLDQLVETRRVDKRQASQIDHQLGAPSLRLAENLP